MNNILSKAARTLGVLTLALLVTGVTRPTAAQVCSALGTTVDNGCTGCSTDITLSCESGADDCEPCQYTFTASITCFPTVSIWTGDDDVECDGKFERRFGGCSSGVAWGSVSCKCNNCGD